MAVTRATRINFAATAIFHDYLKKRPPVFLNRNLTYLTRPKRRNKPSSGWNSLRSGLIRIHLRSWIPLDFSFITNAPLVTRTECEVVVAVGNSPIQRQIIKCSIYGDVDGSVRLDSKDQYLLVQSSVIQRKQITLAVSLKPIENSLWSAPKDMDPGMVMDFRSARYVGGIDLGDPEGNIVYGRRRMLMWNTRGHIGAPRRTECHLDLEVQPVVAPAQGSVASVPADEETLSRKKIILYHFDHGGPDWDIIIGEPFVCIWCKTSICTSIQDLERHLNFSHGQVLHTIETKDRCKVKAVADIYITPNPVPIEVDMFGELPSNVRLISDRHDAQFPKAFTWIKSAAGMINVSTPTQATRTTTRNLRAKFNNTERLVHASSMELVNQDSLDVDSADDVDDEWLWRRNETEMAKRRDISQETKVFMKIWDRFVGDKRVASRYVVSSIVIEFAKKYAAFIQQKSLRQPFALHLSNLYQGKFIEKNIIVQCLSIVDGF